MNLEFQRMTYMTIAIVAGFVLDLIFGDPRWMYHPVRLIGHLISGTERIIRNCLPANKTGERIGGGILVLVVVTVSTAGTQITLTFRTLAILSSYMEAVMPTVLVQVRFVSTVTMDGSTTIRSV